jgi:hypothetical protein
MTTTLTCAALNEVLQEGLEIINKWWNFQITQSMCNVVWKALQHNRILRFDVHPQFPHEIISIYSCFEVTALLILKDHTLTLC